MARAPVLALALLLCASAVLAVDEVCPKYTIQDGDTLYSLAQSMGYSTDELDRSAAMCGYSTDVPIQPGQEICLPGWMDACQFVVQSDPERPYCKAYQVQEGDTLASIANTFNASVDWLATNNDDAMTLDGGDKMPTVGMYMRLPGWDQYRCPDVNDNAPKCRYYIVQEGDSLSKIALVFKLDIAELADVNGMTDASAIQPNQQLKLPPYPTSCTEGVLATVPTDTLQCRVIELPAGGSLYSVALEYGTTYQDVLQANPSLAANPSLVQPGQLINIPPWNASCVGQANLVNATAGDTLPPTYTGGFGDAATPSSAPALAPAPSTTAVPAPAPTTSMMPTPAPMPATGAMPPTSAMLPTAAPPMDMPTPAPAVLPPSSPVVEVVSSPPPAAVLPPPPFANVTTSAAVSAGPAGLALLAALAAALTLQF